MALTREYDHIFNRHRGRLPLAYVRALAQRESGLNPASMGTSAWGILQVTEVVRKDYNLNRRANWSRDELLSAEVCTMIACDLLGRISSAYQQNHGAIRNMGPDWNNYRHIELLTFGWNAGYSQAGGVGLVVKYLSARGAREVTIESVHAAASAAGASHHLSNGDKVEWCKSVAALYMKEKDLAVTASAPSFPYEQNDVAGSGSSGLLIAAGAAIALATSRL